MPPAKNFIDEAVFKQLKTLGIPASAVCADATFIRRMSIDVAGRLPTADETQSILADADTNKRAHWIDSLLASGGYADYFSTKWTSVLRNKRITQSYEHGDFLFHDWIRQSLYENKPYDQFVRDILTASGEVSENPPVAWYREASETTQEMEDTAQLFLGMRIRCAPLPSSSVRSVEPAGLFWVRRIFSHVGKKKGLAANEFRIYHRRGLAAAENIRTHKQVPPAPLGDKPIVLSPEQDPRQSLVDWMVDAKNPFFAPAAGESLLEAFLRPRPCRAGRRHAGDEPGFESGIAVGGWPSISPPATTISRIWCGRSAIRRCISLSAVPNKFTLATRQSYSHYYPKRLTAEALLDAIDQVTAVPTKFNGMPMGTRAVQLPDSGFNSDFLTVFGRPEGSSACECERSNDANLSQSGLADFGRRGTKSRRRHWPCRDVVRRQAAHAGQKFDQIYLEFYSIGIPRMKKRRCRLLILRRENHRAADEDILWCD